MNTKSSERNENASSVVFQRHKFTLALWIMGVGMLLALLWAAFQGWVLGKGYPYDTFLFSPAARFSDFMDGMIVSSLPNPYEDPLVFYLPFFCAFSRALSSLPDSVIMVGVFFLSLAGLVVLLLKVLETIIPRPIQRVLYSFLFLGLSYPVLFCIDRGNIEIELAVLVAGGLFFLGRNKYVKGMLCLLPAVCLKLYPALLFVLLLRQRKVALTTLGAVGFFAITFLSLGYLALPLKATWELYERNMAYFTGALICENYTLEGSASIWNTYKVGLIMAADLGLISPVDFNFDGGFIRTSYAVYSGGMVFLALLLVIYACLVEKEFLRCAVPLLLFLTMATPLGADYRLLYADVALVALVLLKTKRPHDILILILIALTLTPKKEIFLTFAGTTETGFADVSIQVLLNPLCVFAAIAFLLYDGWGQFDIRWSRLRLIRMRHVLLRWMPGRSRFQRAFSWTGRE